jgi:beta-aspartyl-peptidase (threonine type)
MRYLTLFVALSTFPFAARGAEPAQVVLVIHGGSGVLDKREMEEAGVTRQQFEDALAAALKAGYEMLKRDRSSVDAVEAAIRVMEDSELFNAGRGAALNRDGRAELDAAIMEGNMDGRGEGKSDPRKRAGAVAVVSHIKNPISAARAVMEMPGSRHVLLVGEGAEQFLMSVGIERVSNVYFWTDRRLKQIREIHKQNAGDKSRGRLSAADPRQTSVDRRFGTVGAVALDIDNKRMLAAGTSTGGLTDKLPGRVGDSPLLGGGIYADNRACGVSCTGTGEVFMRHAVAHDVVARMLYGEKSVADAVQDTITELPDEEGGVGGLIALDRNGRHAFGISPNSLGMYRGYATAEGQFYVAIEAKDPDKRIHPE